MKKLLLSTSFAAALIFSGGDGLTAHHHRPFDCSICVGGNKCKRSDSWRSGSLKSQRRYCTHCGWGHVRRNSGNYCQKNLSPGNYDKHGKRI